MPDELGPDKTRDLWRNQPLEPAANFSADDLRRRARAFEEHTRRGVRQVAVLMSLAAGGYAALLYFFPSPVHRIGASLTLAGYLYCAYRLRKRGSVESVPSGPPSVTCAAYKTLLERQRDTCSGYWRTLMLPVVPGPAVFVMGFLVPEQGLVRAACLTAALIVSPFVFAVPLLRQRARALQREIDGLDALMR